MMELHQFMGALSQHINAAGSTPADRANLAALVMSDRDFTEDDYERLLALDNTAVKRGMSATALSRIPISKWAGCPSGGAGCSDSASGASSGAAGAAGALGSGTAAAKDAQSSGGSGGSGGGSGSGEEHARCAVCLENYEIGDSVRHLPCLHSYHATCIDKWFEASVECPVCKHDVNKLMDEAAI